MFDLLISILISLAAFGVLLAFIVFIHEYGHFKTARLCGVRVDTFSIGFGPAFLKWTDRHGTVWKVASIPLGGFVKFFGDANAASAGTDAEQRPATTQFGSEKDRLASQLTPEEKAVCFHFKPLWQRAAVVAAGPFANFVLGAVIFTALFMAIGVRSLDPVVGRVQADSPAAAAGFEAGDRIVRIGNRRITDFSEMANRVRLSAGDPLVFTVDRQGQEVTLTATPERVTMTDGVGNEISTGRLGVENRAIPRVADFADHGSAEAAGLREGDLIVGVDGQDIYTFSQVMDATEGRAGETLPVTVERDGIRQTFVVPVTEATATGPDGAPITFASLGVVPVRTEWQRLGPLDAFGAGISQVHEVLETTLVYFGRLLSLREDPRQMGGPVKIAQYAGAAAQSGFQGGGLEMTLGERLLVSLTRFIELAALISISIGFMNLLPIPMLDGGHLLFYGYEAVAGRPLSDGIQAAGFRIGLAIVGSFMIFVLVNDVVGLF